MTSFLLKLIKLKFNLFNTSNGLGLVCSLQCHSVFYCFSLFDLSTLCSQLKSNLHLWISYRRCVQFLWPKECNENDHKTCNEQFKHVSFVVSLTLMLNHCLRTYQLARINCISCVCACICVYTRLRWCIIIFNPN